MTHYRLLRDNKESGPYSEEDMIAKGFKPYDLIWVEGRSAGWRYPSEIPAFKNFAPAIEEQPYDRFYKKQPPQKVFASEEKNTPSYYTAVPAATKTNEPVQQQPSVPPVTKQVPPQQSTPEYTIQSIPGRHIHVTLPSGNTVNLSAMVAKKENKELRETNDAYKAPVAAEIKQPVYNEPVYSAPVATERKQPVAIVDYTLNNAAEENIEPVYVQPQHYQQPAGFSWSLIAAAFIGIATLVGLGIMIGMSINRDKNDLAFNENLRSKTKQNAGQPNSGNTKPSASNAVPDEPAAVNDAVQSPTSTASKELVTNAVVKSTIVPENNIDSKSLKKVPEEKKLSDKNKPLTNQEEPIIRNKPLAPAAVNIEKMLVLTPNDFKTGAFGGISSLKYTLVNSSKFPLESVIVEIDYIQANDKVYKTERLLFKDISAGAQATIEAPPSSRGIKLSTRIIKVNPKETGLTNTTAKS